MKYRIKVASGNGKYDCTCGKVVTTTAIKIQPGGTDYCGCGRTEVILTVQQVNKQRALAGLPLLKEKSRTYS